MWAFFRRALRPLGGVAGPLVVSSLLQAPAVPSWYGGCHAEVRSWHVKATVLPSWYGGCGVRCMENPSIEACKWPWKLAASVVEAVGTQKLQEHVCVGACL